MEKIKAIFGGVMARVKGLGRRRLIISAVAAVLVIALLLGISGAARARQMLPPGSSITVDEKLISGIVESGTLTRTLSLGGAVSDSTAKAVSLAGDIKLESICVAEGDFVEEGELLATVDKESVRTAAAELTELIASVDTAISNRIANGTASSVTAPVSGRVKAIYAESGRAVAETVYTQGALMELSLDGMMAVDIQTQSAAIGAAVTVTRADGSELRGTVFSVSDGTATVTISDEEALPGEEVTISIAGETVATGTLYTHSALHVTGYSGSVLRVAVSVNAPVSEGQTLLTITPIGSDGQYAALLNTRNDLTDMLDTLIRAYETGGIYAECSGRVSDIDDSLIPEAEAEETSSTGALKAAPMAYSGNSTAAMRLLASHSNTRTLMLLSAIEEDTSSSKNNENVTPPAGGEGEGTPPAGGEDESVKTLERSAQVTAIDTSGEGAKTLVGQFYDGGELRISFDELNGKLGEVSADSIKVGDVLILTYNAETSALISVKVYSSSQGEQLPTPGGSQQGAGEQQGTGMASGGSMGGGAGGGMVSGAQSEEETSYTIEETVLLYITPYDTAEISLSVDELDIQSLYVGQEVRIVFDAFDGESFTGTIIEINPIGENSGGSTKYTVIVSLTRTAEMLSGMNCAVTAELENRDGLLLIPVAALSEEADGVYVYTGYDAKNDELINPVAVTTGLSDGTQAEILSGLALGDSYYYRYADTLIYSFAR